MSKAMTLLGIEALVRSMLLAGGTQSRKTTGHLPFGHGLTGRSLKQKPSKTIFVVINGTL